MTQAAKTYGGTRKFEEALARSGSTLADARREIRRALTIAKTRDVAVTAKCPVSDEEALRFFKANPDRFVEPEQLHIYAITVGVDPSSTPAQWAAAKSRAEEARREHLGRRLLRGDGAEVFDRSEPQQRAATWDSSTAAASTDAFEQVAKSLPIGQPSGVIETLYGYHIVRVSEVRPPQPRTFAEVRVNLRRDLAAKRCTDLNESWMAGLRADAEVVVAEPMQ